DHHAREALGIRDRVAEARPLGAAGVGADDQRIALQRSSAPGRRRTHEESNRGDGEHETTGHGLASFCSEKVDCSSPLGSAAAWRTASTTGATTNGASPVTK